MDPTHEEAVRSFDMDLFLPIADIMAALPLLRGPIIPLKRRIVRSGVLMERLSQYEKALEIETQELQSTKQKLDSTMRAYKQTGLDYKKALDNCSKLEKECTDLKAIINRFEVKYSESENSVLAGTAHIQQLQELVKQYEKKIDILEKNERKRNDKLLHEKLAKELSIEKKKYKKDMAACETKYSALLKKFLDMKGRLGKFKKDLSPKKDNADNNSSFGDYIENGDEISVDFIPRFGSGNLSQNDIDMGKDCSISNKHNTHMEISNYCNIRSVSVDTGCGSSLASSDNEKWLNSPDYVFSPIYGGSAEHNPRSKLSDIASSPPLRVKLIETATSPTPTVKLIETATSPTPTVKLVETATSPTPTVKLVETATSPTPTAKLIETSTSPIPPVKMVETATSPITIQPETYINSKCSPEPVTTNNKSVSPIDSNIANIELLEPNENVHTVTEKSPIYDIPELESNTIVENILHLDIQGTLAKDCLELNNSNNIEEDCSINHEIEIILNTMRLNHTPITPIPRTPKKVESQTAGSYRKKVPSEELTHYRCPDAAIAKDQAAAAGKEAAAARKEAAAANERIEAIQKALLQFLLKVDLRDNYLPLKTMLENVINANSNDDIHISSNSAATLENSVGEMDLVRSPTTSVLTDSPNNNSKNTLKTHNIGNLIDRNHENAVSLKPIDKGELEMCAVVEMELVKSPIRSVFTDSQNNNISEQTSKLQNIDTLNNNNHVNSVTLKPIEEEEEIEMSMVEELDPVRSPTPPVFTVPQNNNNSEQTLLPQNIDNLKNSNHGNAVSFKPTEEVELEMCAKQNDISLKPESVMCSNTGTTEMETSKATEKTPVKRVRKLTNLAKYRKKCEVRNRKIRRETPPLKKPRLKHKQVQCHDIKKLTTHDTSATLNDKQVYAKAVKVMAELNAKTPKKSTEAVPNTTIQQDITTHKTVIKSHPSVLASGITSPRLTVLITPLPLSTMQIISPTMKITSPTVKISSSIPEIASPLTKITHPIPEMTTKTPTVSSKSCGASPDFVITSPEIDVASSTRLLRTQKTSVISPMSAVRSSTPIITSPTHLITSPTPSVTSPRRSNDLSGHSITLARPHIILPDLGIRSAAPTIASLNLVKANSIDTAKNCSKHETGISDICTGEVQKDVSINKSLCENSVRKRKLSNGTDTLIKRMLRSNSIQDSNAETVQLRLPNASVTQSKRVLGSRSIPSLNGELSPISIPMQEDASSWHPNQSILCSMIQKYGKTTVRRGFRNVPDAILKNISEKIEEFILKIIESPCNQKKKNLMNELVEELKKYNYKNFISGLLKYMTNPERKMEMFGKVSSPPAPPLTKSEQVLIYAIIRLRTYWHPVDIVDKILSSLEYTLFKLNRTPEFDVVESVSHFYAVICRYFRLPSRLKAFMLDAMYCILYKAAALVKQCLEVWPQIIPLAHMSAAKIPLVTIFVYLLQFYTCDDRFKRMEEIRCILQKRYSYQFTEWNERRLLEVVNNSIVELRDIPCEKKMLRISLILLGKRNGPKWTQNNIIKKLFQLIEKETIFEHTRAFCIDIIGALMKPYPNDMKLHCEIAMDQLLNILSTPKVQRIEEATISSLVLMSRHNFQRVNEILLSTKMRTTMSPEFEQVLIDYVRMKPFKVWIKQLTKEDGFEIEI